VKGRLSRDATLLQEWLDGFFSLRKHREGHIRSRGVKQVDMQCGKG
jgi:hypothetical protein